MVGLLLRWAAISTVTMPVGTAGAPAEQHHQRCNQPAQVRFGVMSPNPTVVMVVMAQ